MASFIGTLATRAPSTRSRFPCRLDWQHLPGLHEMIEDASEAHALATVERIRHRALRLEGQKNAPKLGGVFLVGGLLSPESGRQIPVKEASELVLQWHDNSLCEPVSIDERSICGWAGVRLSTKLPQPDANIDIAGRTVELTFSDAIAMVQRWRELDMVPEDYVWGDEEFWHVHPELRPDIEETVGRFRSAVVQGKVMTAAAGLKHCFEDHRNLIPGSLWIARDGERIDWANGRINMGRPPSEIRQLKETAVAWGYTDEMRSDIDAMTPQWRLAVVGFKNLRQWAIDEFELKRKAHEIIADQPSAEKWKTTGPREERMRKELEKLIDTHPGLTKDFYFHKIESVFGPITKAAKKRIWSKQCQKPGYEHISKPGPKSNGSNRTAK